MKQHSSPSSRLFAAVVSLALAACGMPAEELEELGEVGADLSAADTTRLTGAHYSLNIIGVPQGKSADMTGNQGRRIFVPRSGSSKINLQEGPFEVLDANGTDGSALFQLPNPDPDGDGVTAYSVFARALGKPGGSSKTTSCLTDAAGETYCSVYSMVLTRSTGKSTFTNVSRELLYVYADLDGDGDLDRSSLFSDALASYYWQYDNAGLHLAQLRFYEQIKTTVPAP